MSSTTEQNIKHLCASTHSISSLRRFCRTHKIDDTKTNSQRQRMETRILAMLGWWMTTTGKTDKERMSWVAYLETHQLTKMPAETQTDISERMEDWLIAMRAIEHAYVLLRKNSDLEDRTPPGDLAFIGWETSEVNGGPGLCVIVNDNTCAGLINWGSVARDGVYQMTVDGKPRCYGMPATTELKGFRLGMD